MDQRYEGPTLSKRRSAKHLPPIQTSPTVAVAGEQSDTAIGVQHTNRQDASPALLTPTTPSLRSRGSRMSLLGLFSRPKVEKQRYHSEPGVPSLMPTPSKSPERPTARRSSKSEPTLPTKTEAATARTKPMSSTSSQSQRKLDRSPARSRQKSEVLRRTDSMTAAWTPPPLFQAYPQAINHITLEASTISANSIIRARKHQRQYSLIQEMMETKLDIPDTYRMAQKATKKGPDETKLQRRMSMGSAAVMDYTKKTYILVTSGYLLQYAGDGPSERFPEKSLQLGKDSAAFACDLIEGKHYVLQVCQRIDGEGKTAPSKTILSKFRLPSSPGRRTTSNILMIFENSKEMDLWMTLIRREIEAFGGRRYGPEGEIIEEDDVRMDEARESQQPSHRYRIRRDPNQFSSQTSPAASGLNSPVIRASHPETASLKRLDSASDVASLHSSQHLHSMTHSVNTTSASAVPTANQHVPGTQKGFSRLSYISTAPRASREPSPVRAPSIDDFPLPGQAITASYKIPPPASPSRTSANVRKSVQNFTSPVQSVARTSEPYQRRQRHYLYDDTEEKQNNSQEPAVVPLLPAPLASPSASTLLSGSGQPNRRYTTSSSRSTPSIPPTIVDETVTGDGVASDVGDGPSTPSSGPRSFQFAPGVAVRPGNRPFPLPIRVTLPSVPPLPSIPTAFAQSPTAKTPSPLQPAVPELPTKSMLRPASVQIRADHAPFLSSTNGNPRIRSSIGEFPSKSLASPATEAAKYALHGHYSRVPAYALPPMSAPPPDTPLPQPPMPISPTYLTA